MPLTRTAMPYMFQSLPENLQLSTDLNAMTYTLPDSFNLFQRIYSFLPIGSPDSCIALHIGVSISSREFTAFYWDHSGTFSLSVFCFNLFQRIYSFLRKYDPLAFPEAASFNLFQRIYSFLPICRERKTFPAIRFNLFQRIYSFLPVGH